MDSQGVNFNGPNRSECGSKAMACEVEFSSWMGCLELGDMSEQLILNAVESSYKSIMNFAAFTEIVGDHYETSINDVISNILRTLQVRRKRISLHIVGLVVNDTSILHASCILAGMLTAPIQDGLIVTKDSVGVVVELKASIVIVV